MQTCETKEDLRRIRADLGRSGARIGLVPTMGYLHDGHLALVARARAECDRVIATIFVNPAQFGPNEDFAAYPRDHPRDLAMLRAAGVDAVFLPTPKVMYAPGAQTEVSVAGLSRILMGALRPGHLDGVALVVTKLLNLAQPHAAYFGQKDYQQLALIRILVRDLDLPVRIVGVPTARAADGLALSSRNVRLTPEHRAAAPALHRALTAGATDLRNAEAAMRRVLEATPGAEIASIDIRDAETLAPLAPGRAAILLVAVRFGDVLLIDNMTAEAP